ncbi:hypothetical protein Dimus_012276 [Dionaea muscipula]
MAGTIRCWGSCYIGAPSRFHLSSRQIHGIRCSSDPNNDKRGTTPNLLKFAVTGVTEILRAFSPYNNRVRAVEDVKGEEILISGVDDVVEILRSDYENAYFVTGVFTNSVYANDCIFEDPTINFRGTDLYYRNLKLLVPFFDDASIILQELEKGANSGRNFVLAKWRLRTYLKLPWMPLIMIDGSTIYDLNDEFKIVRHAESWNVSAMEAVSQIFTPGSRNADD